MQHLDLVDFVSNVSSKKRVGLILLFYREDTQQINTLNSTTFFNSNKHTELATPVELSLIFMLSLFDYFRINVATQGNKKSKVVPMAWATLLGCPIVIGGYVVLLKMQTQTSPFDNYLNTVPLSFIATEFALSVPAMIAFQKKS